MGDGRHGIKTGLVWLGLFHLAYFCIDRYAGTAGIKGVVYPDSTPVGGDFINLWTVARLVLTGRAADIYRVGDFMAYQATLTGGADIGLRLWAYPPHSLLLAWPFGLVGYYTALLAWSLAGLAVLAAGARRFGFDARETAVLLLSPATVLNLYHGQTGSFAAGVLLLALSARGRADPVSVGAAALLTLKPQTGFLLPVLWAFQRRWREIAWTALATVAFVGLALAVFGAGPWRDYVGDTLPVLGLLEREGSGPFMTMIPSVFMSMRIVSGNPTIALAVHGGFAVAVAIFLLWRLRTVSAGERQASILLLATVLITPYMHNYDLVLLLCGALLVARRWAAAPRQPAGSDMLVLVAWAMPQLVVLLNTAGLPIAPLLILPLLLLA